MKGVIMTKTSLSFSFKADHEWISRQHPSQRVLELAIQAPAAQKSRSRTPLNLALVIDRSGSMAGEKLVFARLAAQHVVDLLKEGDRAALVAYDDTVDLLQASTPIHEESRRQLKEAIASLKPGQSTDLGGGWLRGCQEVAAFQDASFINRSLLLTDGLANCGIIDLEELAHHASQLHSRGISTSTFGLGEGFNEHLLEQMANQGGGNFYFIESPQDISNIFLRELDEMLQVTARNLELTLTLPPFLDFELLGGWKHTRENGKLLIQPGDLAAGQHRQLYLKIYIPSQITANEIQITAHVTAMSESGTLLEQERVIRLQYASKEELEAAQPDPALMRRYALVFLAHTVSAALMIERKGEGENAARLLEAAVESCRLYLTDEKLREIHTMLQQFRNGMSVREQKIHHQISYAAKQTRSR
jgi:Ca-activated chloride channel homolog